VVGRRAVAPALATLAALAGGTGCGGGGSTGGDDAAAARTRDLRILTRVLQRENRIIAGAAAAGAVLHGGDARLGSAALAAAETHTANLTRAIRKLGGTPHQPRQDYSGQVVGRRGRAQLLTLVAALGTRAARADRRAAPRVSDEDFRGLTQAVAVSDSAHAERLRRAAAAR
jgi:hypothetical protein